MKVYKFGGASIATPARARDIVPIIKDADDSLTVVISAMGKTTNALEKIVSLACSGEKEAAQEKAKQLELDHLKYAEELLDNKYFLFVKITLSQYLISLDMAISKASASAFDKSYDGIVCYDMFQFCWNGNALFKNSIDSN
jgi:aspartate kinase